MYRLFKYRQIFLCNPQPALPKNGTDLRLQICSFCNQAYFRTSKSCKKFTFEFQLIFNNILIILFSGLMPIDSVRFHSMNMNSATIPTLSQQRKKSKRPRKKFTELLQGEVLFVYVNKKPCTMTLQSTTRLCNREGGLFSYIFVTCNSQIPLRSLCATDFQGLKIHSHW